MTGPSVLASRVAAILAVDPEGLGGIWLRARHGPRRDAMMTALEAIPGIHGKVMPEAGEVELFGGIDLSESLFSGQIVPRQGLLERSGVLWVTRAERMPIGMASRIAAAIDAKSCGLIILADESSEDGDLPAAALRDRLAFFLTDQIEETTLQCSGFSSDEVMEARQRIGQLIPRKELIELSVRLCGQLGCHETRPPMFLLRAARAIAALEGSETILQHHLAEATRYVMAHRGMPAVEAEEDQNQPEVEEGGGSNTKEHGAKWEEAVHDILLEASSVRLPDDLLGKLIGKDRRAAGSGQGAERTSFSRGRPLPSRPGKPNGRARLDLLSTLQAAAPWQKLRKASEGRLAVYKDDLRVRRYRERSERVLIFLVDASGSAAMARLAEAKGAAETLLSEAYRSRDHVSLVTFRGDEAECVLQPTRSLVRAKRLLGGLPGGGTTPLAAALRQGAEQASLARKKGLSPQIILMTDGRANKALDGSTDRDSAREDALRMAKWLRADNVPALVVDSGLRPSAELAEIAKILDAAIIRLPKGQGVSGSDRLLAALDT